MEAIVHWVQAMQDDGHAYTEIRVAEPWRQALLDAGHSAELVGPPHSGNEELIEYITEGGSFLAVLSR